MENENRTVSLADLKKEAKAATNTPTPKVQPKMIRGLSSTALEESATIKRVATTDMAPKRPPLQNEKPEIDKMMDRLDSALERTKEDLKPIIAKGKEIIIENRMRAEEEKAKQPQQEQKPITREDVTAPAYSVAEVGTNPQPEEEPLTLEDMKDDFLDELEDPEDQEESEETTEESEEDEAKRLETIREKFKPLIKAAIDPDKGKVDVSKFTIKTKPMSYSRLLATGTNPKYHESEWVLPNTGVSITMRELTGPELVILAEENNNNTVNTYKRMYSIFYNHIVDKNKPPTLEAWLKRISFFDMKHLFFAVYKASFEESNYIPYICIKKGCDEPELVKINIKDMVKFETPKDEQRFKECFEKDSTSSDYTEEKLFVVSDKYAIGCTLPTLYSVVFENTVIQANNAFREKYADVLGHMSFISNIYTIDMENQALIPIDTKPDANDLRKTIQNKYKIYYRILSTLNSDQYNAFVDYINKLALDSEVGIDYVVPAHTCSKCGTVIPEEIINPLRLVFTRHQLTLTANS